MRKSVKIFAFLMGAVMAMTVLGCNKNPVNSSSSSELSDSDVNKDYVPFDESLRIDDVRNLTDNEYSVMNIVGTDDFGRSILSVDGKKDNERYVGMFYFLTLGQHTNHRGIYDIDQITEQGNNYDAFTKVNNATSPLGAAHFWGEPVWGYYNSEDPWVMRKQIEMLTMADIDFIVLDTSNNVLYSAVTKVLFPIMLEYQNQGWNVPKIVYYLGKHNLDADKKAIKEAYTNFYGVEEYKSLFFTPNDPSKPMVIAPDTVISAFQSSSDVLEKKLDALFDYRVTQWPIDPPVNDPVYENGAPWIDFKLPQTSENGWISLSTAQHVTVKMTDTQGSRGRGWTPTKKINGVWYGTNDHENWRQGQNYQAQWNTVLNMTDEQKKGDAKYTFLTGWNEWVAEKLDNGDGTYFTCDTFNSEYSRDIEPSRSNGMKDNAYLQTVQNIHVDNYNAAKHYKYSLLTPDLTKDDIETWNSVKANYRDFTGEAIARNFKPMAGLENLTDRTNRNDISKISVTHDAENLYFRIECVDDITEYESGDNGWMNIWIKTANGSGDMLNGYNYVINRSITDGVTEIMRCKSKKDILSVGKGEVKVYGKAAVVKVPLSVLKLSSSNYAFEFKVTDNVQNVEKDILNLYCTGDAAPIGRLNYSYGF